MISVVIPALHALEMTDQLLNDIAQNSIHPAEIILIDNNTNQENIFHLVQKYNSLNFVYLKNSENIGVNASWNLGRKLSKYKYITIMNNDIRIHKDFLKETLETMEADVSIGLCSSKISDKIEDVLNQEYHPENSIDVESMSGNCFTISKLASDEIGPIPKELFTFYGDDFILSRIKQLGYRSVLMESNYVFHYGHVSIYKWKKTEKILENYYSENIIFDEIKKQYNFDSFHWNKRKLPRLGRFVKIRRPTEKSRRDGIDAHFGRKLLCKRLCRPDQTRLRRTIHTVFRPRPYPTDIDNIYYLK